jgi:putative oxidoreductase
MTAAGLLVLRLAVAAILLTHGVGPGGLTATAARFSTLGLEPGYALAVTTGTLQLLAGALIAIGVLTRWAAVATSLYVGLMIWKDQWRWGFFSNWLINPERGHGVEQWFMLAAALVCLALAGAGDWSVDGRRARAAAARASGRARLRRN